MCCCTDDLSFGFKPYIATSKPVSIGAKTAPLLKALITACGFKSFQVKVKGRTCVMYRMTDGEAARRLLSISSQLSYENPFRVIRVWDGPKLKDSLSPDVRELMYFDPTKMSERDTYSASSTMLTDVERSDPTGVLPGYMLRHKLADAMVRTNDQRIKSVVEVELDCPVSMFDIYLIPHVIKNFGYSITTSYEVVVRYSFQICSKDQTTQPRLVERFDDLKQGAVIPQSQIDEQFMVFLASVAPPPGAPRPPRTSNRTTPPPPNPAHLAEPDGAVPPEELCKGKKVCMMFEVGGVQYAFAGVVSAPPKGQRVRVKFLDGSTFDCQLARMLAIAHETA